MQNVYQNKKGTTFFALLQTLEIKASGQLKAYWLQEDESLSEGWSVTSDMKFCMSLLLHSDTHDSQEP